MHRLKALALGAALLGWAGTAAAQRPLPPLPLMVHVAQVDGSPVVDEAWVAQQVATANQIFAAHGLVVRVEGVEPLLRPALADIGTRADRDALGAANVASVVNVYVVASLADVDASGERRGVHWRVRAGHGRHLVIVSRAAGGSTLAHELGHFFGLPHSHVVDDLMSYDRRGPPFLSEAEGATMRERARQYLRSRELRAAAP